MKYKEAWEGGCRMLRDEGIAEAELDARLLLEHVCRTSRHDLLLHGDREMKKEQQQEYIRLMRRRAKREPLQYILGCQELMGIRFLVNREVLIPRQDTETVIETALSFLSPGQEVLDLCTGTGCILLSLMKYCPGIEGIGTDLSEKAVETAKQNAALQKLPARFLCSDLFEQISGRYDVIVSNPPYIKTKEIDSLMAEVRSYEPLQALCGGEDGLWFYRKITRQAPAYLKEGGRLFYEIGHDQAIAVKEIMAAAGFADIAVRRDLAGHDRVVFGIFKGR